MNPKYTALLILSLVSASAAHASVGEKVAATFGATTAAPVVSSLTLASLTSCGKIMYDNSSCHSAVDQNMMADAMNFLAGGQITPELREKLDVMRTELQPHMPEGVSATTVTDEELCQAIVNSQSAAQ